MRHLIVCREYPPAPGGGIGTYAHNISRLLAESGETVHVIGQVWNRSENGIEEKCNGRLIIHRVPFEDRIALLWPRASSLIDSKVARALYASDYPPLCFSWQAGAMAERLVEEEGIDLIEAQDYEAPLYYFQLRRALGLGPKRRPPCFVHLHSPTEFTARHNDWDIAQPALLVANRVEHYSISAADALLCPSRYLARQAEARYGLPADSVEVIPYPLGEAPSVERDQATWSGGSICYVGRLEKRKGVLEWIDAAIEVARQNSNASFEFVGANVLGANPILSEAFLDGLIPGDLKARFIFHGKVDRWRIPEILKRARIAVVPSRWENFPHTCVEAMVSGLPVIASPEGGMTEMIVDGQTGWIAPRPDSAGLGEALMRALTTPAERIAEMGGLAAVSIRRICDNQKIVERHLRSRRSLVDRGARSVAQPSMNRPAVERRPSARVSPTDLLADYHSNGFQKAAHQGSGEDGNPEGLERFRQSVGSDAQRTGSGAATSSGWNGRAYDPLATIRCLIGNPKISFRVARQIAAELARR